MEAARVAQLAAMNAAALVAELRALSDADGSCDEQVLCCVLLHKVSPLPTGAAAEDAVRAVVSALTRGVPHAALQMTGCDALGMLVDAAPATSATVGAEGVAAVLAALRAHPGDAGVQGAACFALSELTALDEANRATAGAAGGVAAVVAAVTRHAATKNVALRGCAALANLTDDHPLNAAAALDVGAVAAALAAMRAFPADAEVQESACCALDYHLVHCERSRHTGRRSLRRNRGRCFGCHACARRRQRGASPRVHCADAHFRGRQA
jgi:hypothetical protein